MIEVGDVGGDTPRVTVAGCWPLVWNWNQNTAVRCACRTGAGEVAPWNSKPFGVWMVGMLAAGMSGRKPRVRYIRWGCNLMLLRHRSVTAGLSGTRWVAGGHSDAIGSAARQFVLVVTKMSWWCDAANRSAKSWCGPLTSPSSVRLGEDSLDRGDLVGNE